MTEVLIFEKLYMNWRHYRN